MQVIIKTFSSYRTGNTTCLNGKDSSCNNFRELICNHLLLHSVFFFSCLTDKRQPIAPPDALPALRLTPRLGEV